MARYYKVWRPGQHPRNKEDVRHQIWWKNNKIRVCVAPHWTGTQDQWRVELYINDYPHKDPKIYTAGEAHKKMYEYYKYYYEKYNV